MSSTSYAGLTTDRLAPALRPEPPTSRRRRVFAVALVAFAAALLTLAPAALAGFVTPEHGGSPNADEINDLYKIVLYVAIVVFVGVEGALLYSVLRFRQRKGRVAAQIRGNTSLEIGWTVGAALVLVVLTVVTFIKLPSINDPARTGSQGLSVGGPVLYASVNQPRPPGGKALNIEVNGQQYVWRYTYPNDAYSYEEMVVPTNTTVVLRVVAQDVIHSWWIPKLGGKVDATPGYTNKTWFKIPKEGVYRGQCAELCGRNHANMLAQVRAVSPTEYQSWVDEQKKLINQANADAAKQRKQLSPIPG
jgi:cytochrome c oxidase subunit 2